MGELLCLHDYVMSFMILVMVTIGYVFSYLLCQSFYYKSLSEGTFIETIWSFLPAVLLMVLVVPSMKVLYLMEDIKHPIFSFKVVAHQWYWTYVVPLFNNFSFKINNTLFSSFECDSLVNSLEGSIEHPRLLGGSSSLYVPVMTTSRFLVSSTDVIHSFSLPSLGLKVDALPGRINQLYTNPSRVGIFYGQCSEICGTNHSFMPIMLKVGSLSDFDGLCKGLILDILSDQGISELSV